MRPLEGITVVTLEHAVAAPLATRHLADLGARVIKVERPGVGDFARDYDHAVRDQSSYFVWLNRGKESIELDVKNPADHALLRRILKSADVFVQNLAPGAAARLGLDADTLRRADPRLIHCSISGYGENGPYGPKKAYDLLIQCEAGLVAATGSPEEPAKVGISVADIATGMYAYSGVLAALYQREATGEGSEVRVAMLDALAEWMTQPAYLQRYGERPLRRTGPRHASIAPYGPFRVADGTVFLAVQNEREWAALCASVLDRPDLTDDPRFAGNDARVANEPELRELIEEELSASGREQVLARLEAAGIASAAMREPVELFEHPQLVARGRWAPVETPGGSVLALRPPVSAGGAEVELRSVPALGEHNDRIRGEFEEVPR